MVGKACGRVPTFTITPPSSLPSLSFSFVFATVTIVSRLVTLVPSSLSVPHPCSCLHRTLVPYFTTGSQAPSHCTTGPALEPAVLNISQWLAQENNEHITRHPQSLTLLGSELKLEHAHDQLLGRLDCSEVSDDCGHLAAPHLGSDKLQENVPCHLMTGPSLYSSVLELADTQTFDYGILLEDRDDGSGAWWWS